MYFKRKKKQIKAMEFHLAAEHLARYVKIFGETSDQKKKKKMIHCEGR